MWGLRHPSETIISKAGENPIPWDEVKLILWSPDVEGYSENLDQQIILVRKFFEYMAIRMLSDALYDTSVVFTINNIKFSQLQVSFLHLTRIINLIDLFYELELSFTYQHFVSSSLVIIVLALYFRLKSWAGIASSSLLSRFHMMKQALASYQEMSRLTSQ